MNVVILAAGTGSRLGQSADHLPKPLTELENGQSILDLQIKALSQHVPLKDIIIVVGYHREEIVSRFPECFYVYNPDYASENTSKSLLRALKKCTQDVLWLNGDVVFHPSVLDTLLSIGRTSMVVNVGPVGDEEVKYRSDKQGLIVEVSKQVKNPLGEALGINFFLFEDLPLFKAKLEKCEPQDYFEKGIEMCIEEGVSVWSVPVASHLCTEVDFPEDLDRANKLLHSWT